MGKTREEKKQLGVTARKLVVVTANCPILIDRVTVFRPINHGPRLHLSFHYVHLYLLQGTSNGLNSPLVHNRLKLHNQFGEVGAAEGLSRPLR